MCIFFLFRAKAKLLLVLLINTTTILFVLDLSAITRMNYPSVRHVHGMKFFAMDA